MYTRYLRAGSEVHGHGHGAVMQEPGYTAHAKRAVLFSVLLAFGARVATRPRGGRAGPVGPRKYLSLGDLSNT